MPALESTPTQLRKTRKTRKTTGKHGKLWKTWKTTENPEFSISGFSVVFWVFRVFRTSILGFPCFPGIPYSIWGTVHRWPMPTNTYQCRSDFWNWLKRWLSKDPWMDTVKIFGSPKPPRPKVQCSKCICTRQCMPMYFYTRGPVYRVSVCQCVTRRIRIEPFWGFKKTQRKIYNNTLQRDNMAQYETIFTSGTF